MIFKYNSEEERSISDLLIIYPSPVILQGIGFRSSLWFKITNDYRD
jgi:hypothetical protein